MRVELNPLEETLVLPLWHRAQISKAYPSLLNDPKAVELVDYLQYDFSTFEQRFTVWNSLWFAARARQFDDKLPTYIGTHPRASVVNLGAGLDTAFYRVDNGLIHWHDLDLPNVIALREQLLPETRRIRYIAKSLFDMSWRADIGHTDNGLFILASGVLVWFEEAQVRHFLSSLADVLPGAELVFDANSKVGASAINRSLKDVDITDVEVTWELEDALIITRWDGRLNLIEQIPLFAIPLNPAWGEQALKIMDSCDQINAYTIVHLKV